MYERYIQILYADMPKKKRLFIMNSLFFERQETQNRPLSPFGNSSLSEICPVLGDIPACLRI